MLEERPDCKPIDVIFGARRKTSRPVSGMNREERRDKLRKNKKQENTAHRDRMKADVLARLNEATSMIS